MKKATTVKRSSGAKTKPRMTGAKAPNVLNVHIKFDVHTFGQVVMAGLGGPVAEEVSRLLAVGDYPALVNYYVDPADYSNAVSYMDAKQAVALLQKYPKFKHKALKPQAAARETFEECEKACGAENVQWQWRGFFEKEAFVPDVFHVARRKIQAVLGNFDADEWGNAMKFGPGTATAVKGTSDYAKLSHTPSVTREFEPFGRRIISNFPAWARSLSNGESLGSLGITVVPGGKYSQVPKTAKTHRNIEIQPLLNGFAQLGLGTMLRWRLKDRANVDLDDQSRNQDLAEYGSRTWRDFERSVATIDLSNASDMISTGLVRWLIPPDWFHAMDVSRTHQISVQGRYRPLQRFCSMGNGFCFELESLIFWALTSASVQLMGGDGRMVSVYGDDIICPCACYDQVLSTLSGAGFQVNTKKSFNSGPFRESCGTDWWNGCNVRPIFLKEHPTEPGDVIRLANSLFRVSSRSGLGFTLDRRYRGAIAYVQRLVPLRVRSKIIRGWGEIIPPSYEQAKRRNSLGLPALVNHVSECDDILISLRAKTTRRRKLVFLQKRNYNLNWFPSLATALYRLWVRGKEVDVGKPVPSLSRAELFTKLKTEAIIGARTDVVVDESRTLTKLFDYRRDHGYWTWRNERWTNYSRSDHVSWA